MIRNGLDDPRGFTVSLRNRQTQREIPVEFLSLGPNEGYTGDWIDNAVYTFQVENGRRFVRLNPAACLPILDGTADIVMRATRPALVSR